MNINDELKPAAAELIGTFTLVFIGAGAGALAGGTGGGGLVGVALAHGVALMVIIYAWGIVSGAHVNPAVTFGLAITGKITWVRTLFYWVAQLLGAALASGLLAYLLRNMPGGLAVDPGLGATVGALTRGDPLRAAIVEAVLTFFLVAAVFGTAVSGRNGNAVGIAIGLVLTMDILMGGPLTGGSMNPARTFGPALVTGDFSYFWIYVVGPLVGSAAAALLYNFAFLPTPRPAPPPVTRKGRR